MTDKDWLFPVGFGAALGSNISGFLVAYNSGTNLTPSIGVFIGLIIMGIVWYGKKIKIIGYKGGK